VLTSDRRARASAAARLLAVAAAAGLLFAALAVPAVGGIGIITRDAANKFNNLAVPSLGQLPVRSEILDEHGHALAYYYPSGFGSKNTPIDRIPVSYGRIAPVMREAIIAIEDSRYYQHGALDFKGTLRAIINDAEHHPTQGGSSIAQQYVKNALVLTATNAKEKTAATAFSQSRKIRELRIAIQVEHEMSKNQLLAAYLNAISFNNQAVGIQVAAERYFHTTAKRLSLPQAAMLAGMVEDPTKYDPFIHPVNALNRRNTVLARMAQLHDITVAEAQAAGRTRLGLHPSNRALQSGCTSRSIKHAAFFCDYVLAVMRSDPAYAQAEAQLKRTGGLKIYTTLNRQDQRAAQHAVNYMLPAPPSSFNPGRNAAAEVLMQPGTGKVRAIAVDRPYGVGKGQDNIDYAVDTRYDGGEGVQTGSSSKLFTLLTALEDHIPFGFNQKIVSPTVVGGFTNCHGQLAGNPPGDFPVTNAEGKGKGTFTLYNGTTQSINVFYAHLEQKVGLCAVVKTAVKLGVHRADGSSLLKFEHTRHGPIYPADDIPSFTLGSVSVSPMTMAAAYATVAARGRYCSPIAIGKILDITGQPLPVKSAHCRQVIPKAVADAATHILQGVMVSPGTAVGDEFTQHGVVPPQAGKTGTANNFEFAAFGGYTPRLAGYVSMFYPAETRAMEGQASCYRSAAGLLDCPFEIFGANAGQIWQFTFDHADLGKSIANFVPVPADSIYYSKGTGVSSPKPPKPPKPTKPPGGGGHGGGGPPGGGGHGHGGGGGGGGGHGGGGGGH
jgi:membrane peptidoglycan carboxypeptidase